MAIFPTDDPTQSTAIKRLRPQRDYESGFLENVRRARPESGKSQNFDIWGRTRFWADFSFNSTNERVLVLYNFMYDNRLNEFTFYDFDEEYVVAQNIGTGNGVNTTFTVPAKELREQTVWVNGVLTTAYTITRATGTLGEDRIVFTVAPANTHAVTITYLGRRRFTCEMAEAAEKKSAGYRRQLVSAKVQESLP